jgi:ABC-2 type transport system permease protein
MHRIRSLIVKEFVELRRDPRALRVVLVAPVVQLLLLGYAATLDIQDVPTVVVDHDGTAASRDLLSRFETSPYFRITGTRTSVNEIDDDLLTANAWLGLVVPEGYGERITRGEPATVQAIVDGTDGNSSNIVIGYASTLVAGYAADLVTARLPVLRKGSLGVEVRVWFNPQLESRLFMVPAVLALVLLVMTTMLTAMAIVREREQGTLEQLNVTPITPSELMVGKLLPYGLIGLVDVILVMGMAVFWFEVPLRGSPFLLLGLTLVYLLNTLGLGLFVSTVSRTQQQAMMTTAFFIMMPMVYLSGFIVPIENMPRVIQQFSYILPLRYYLVIVRSIFLKGVGLETLWPQATALLGLGLVIFGLSVLRSSKQVG